MGKKKRVKKKGSLSFHASNQVHVCQFNPTLTLQQQLTLLLPGETNYGAAPCRTALSFDPTSIASSSFPGPTRETPCTEPRALLVWLDPRSFGVVRYLRTPTNQAVADAPLTFFPCSSLDGGNG